MDCAQSEKDGSSEVEADAPENSVPPRWQIGEILQGRRVAIIEHAGAEYRLRLTANDKLILTK